MLASTCIGASGLRASPISVRPAATRDVACGAKKKGVRCVITLECTEARALGKTPSRYTTQKNKKNKPERLEIMKYNKYLKKMTLHKEIK